MQYSIFILQTVVGPWAVVVLVCREKDGEYKCSLRSRKIPIAPVLQKALVGVRGRGGGHEYACGAVINVDDFDRFVGNFKRELGG